MIVGSRDSLIPTASFVMTDVQDGISDGFSLAGKTQVVAKLSLLFDGLGSGSGDSTFTATVYDFDGTPLGTSLPETIHDGQAAGQIDFTFATPVVREWDGSDTGMGVSINLVSGTASAARVGLAGKLSHSSLIRMSGNEVFDPQRIAARSWPLSKQGGGLVDGIQTPYGVAMFPAITNRCIHGQNESVAHVSAISGGTTFAIDPTVPAPFSPQSIKVICDGTLANQGVYLATPTGQAAAVGAVGQAGVWLKASAATLAYFIQAQWVNTDASIGSGTQISFGSTVTGQWQFFVQNATNRFVTVAGGKIGDQLRMKVFVSGTRADAFWVAHPMLEWAAPGANNGTGRFTSAYVPTAGAIASIPASRMRIPARVIDKTQSWFTMKLSPYAATGAPIYGGAGTSTLFPVLFRLGDDVNNFVGGWLNDGSTTPGIACARRAAGVGAASLKPVSWSCGDRGTGPLGLLRLMPTCAWTATEVKSTNNGAAFTSQPNTSIPNISSDQAEIGSFLGTLQLFGRILWFICGQGTLTDADVVTLNAYGDTLPSFETVDATFPAALLTMRWHCLSPVAVMRDGPAGYLTTFDPFAPAPDSTAIDIARLPFAEAQAAMLKGGRDGAPILTTLGWHGQDADPRRGSYALVNPYGPLAGTVGRVLRITPRDGSAHDPLYALVLSDQAAIEDDPLTVTRSLFQRIALATDYDFPVTVEVVPE